jgi:hypothetical protein
MTRLFGWGFFGQKLYYDDHPYKNAAPAFTLSVMYPEQAPELRFKNPVLATFSNAVWHCATAAKVCIVLNEAASKSSEPEDAASMTAAFRSACGRHCGPSGRRPGLEVVAE